MKGIVLAGGSGSRLMPLTKVTNKHLLPVYDKPMIYYPINTLIDMGIKDIMILSGRGHAGHFLELLGSGQEFGARFNYTIQEGAGGIAEALGLCEDFADGEPVCVVLGDNIFQDRFDISSYKGQGAVIFLKEVNDAKRFGVATLDDKMTVKKIVEKPQNPQSNYAVTGLYIYDNKVFDIIRTLKRSDRGELEITDVNNRYIDNCQMQAMFVDGYWTDAGTIESLFRATKIVREENKK